MHIHIKYWNSNNKNKRSGKVSSRSSSAHKEMLPCMLRSSRSPPLSVRWRQDCARLKSPPLCSRRESHHFGGRDEKWASLRAQPALTADNPSVFFFTVVGNETAGRLIFESMWTALKRKMHENQDVLYAPRMRLRFSQIWCY